LIQKIEWKHNQINNADLCLPIYLSYRLC